VNEGRRSTAARKYNYIQDTKGMDLKKKYTLSILLSYVQLDPSYYKLKMYAMEF
jgi:hypothetical protein